MPNFSASIKERLLKHAKEANEDFTGVLIRFATNRFLYRLFNSPNKDKFVLKGSLLFLVWSNQLYRPTKDADLLGCGPADESSLRRIFKDACFTGVEEDGLIFDADSSKVTEIRKQEEYNGKRIELRAKLDTAIINIQLDIGFGDVITPAAEFVTLPTFLGLSPVELKAYPKESVIAEKTEALVKLGMTNGRMKDFSDIYTLSMSYEFNGPLLSTAMAATFVRRKTLIPNVAPLALTPEFYSDRAKTTQWSAFRTKISVLSRVEFDEVGKKVIAFVLPPLLAKGDFNKSWRPSDGWLKAI